MYDTVVIFGLGVVLGAVLFWLASRLGYKQAENTIYNVKENLPPETITGPPLEQDSTLEEIE